jgi:hypothetical protein
MKFNCYLYQKREAVFTLQQISEKLREFNLPTFILLVDYEKAYDSLNRGKLWQILREEGMSTLLLKSIQCLYKNSRDTHKIQ